MKTKTVAFALVLLLLGYSSSRAQLIGVQVYENAYPSNNAALTASQSAGVLPQENFNIVSLNSGIQSGSLALKTSTGGSSGVTFSFAGNTNDFYTGTGTSTPNDTLLSGQFGDYKDASPATYQFSGVAAGVYDLVVYTVTNSTGQPAEVQLTTGTTSGPTAYYDLEQNGTAFTGSFILGSATTEGSATTANYVEFLDVSPVSGVLKLSFPNLNSLSSPDGIGLNGFQLEAVPEPSALGLMGGSAALLLAFGYRRRLALS